MSEAANNNDCPRCVGMPDYGIDYSKWPDDGHCKKCGSLNADTFMARLEVGTVSLDPTDKNYKVYVHNAGGESFKRSHRIDKMEDRIKSAAGNMVRSAPTSLVPTAVESFLASLTEDDRADMEAYKKGDPLDPMKNWKWTTEERNETKFYFEHLNEAQMRRFVELLNEKKLKINNPGYFYRRPFFIQMPQPAG